MKILDASADEQIKYQEEIYGFLKEFLQNKDFSENYFKSKLLFAIVLDNIFEACGAAVENFSGKEEKEHFGKQERYFEAIRKSFWERENKLGQ